MTTTLQEILVRRLLKASQSAMLSGGTSSFSKSVSPTLNSSPSTPKSITEGSRMTSRSQSLGDSKPSTQDGLRGGESSAAGALRKVTAKPTEFPDQQIPKIQLPMPSMPQPPSLKTSASPLMMLSRGLQAGFGAAGRGAMKGGRFLAGKAMKAPVGVKAMAGLGAIGLGGYGAAKGVQAAMDPVIEQRQRRAYESQPFRDKRNLTNTWQYGSGSQNPQSTPYSPYA